jgi:hypothetical protein
LWNLLTHQSLTIYPLKKMMMTPLRIAALALLLLVIAPSSILAQVSGIGRL